MVKEKAQRVKVVLELTGTANFPLPPDLQSWCAVEEREGKLTVVIRKGQRTYSLDTNTDLFTIKRL